MGTGDAVLSKIPAIFRAGKKLAFWKSTDAAVFFIIAASFVVFEMVTFFITFGGNGLFERILMVTVITSSSIAIFFNPSSFPPIHIHLSGVHSTAEAWKNDKKREERIIVNGFIMAYGYLLFSLITSGVLFILGSNIIVDRIAASLISGAVAIFAIWKKLLPIKISEKYWEKSIFYLGEKPPIGVLMMGFGYSIMGLSTTGVFIALVSVMSMGIGNASLLFSLLSHGLLISILIMEASLVLIYDEEKIRILALNCDTIRSGALWITLILSLALLLSAI